MTTTTDAEPAGTPPTKSKTLSELNVLLGVCALVLVGWNLRSCYFHLTPPTNIWEWDFGVYISPTLKEDLVMAPVIGTAALAMTAFAELLCIEDIRKLLRKKGGAELYRQAWVANLINTTFILPLTSIAWRFCTGDPPVGLSLQEQVRSVIGIVVLESYLYYAIHKAFHDYPSIYWMHRFHHKFNDVILPSTANAVSVPEYISALILPCLIAGNVMGADRASGGVASAIIGVASMLIHCPFMLRYADRFPAWMVSAECHFRHHQKTRGDFGAPTLNFDNILKDLYQSMPDVGSIASSAAMQGRAK